MVRTISLFLYYAVARWLPVSYSKIGGVMCKKIRYTLCKNIFEYCGRNVNIERGATFGRGDKIRIGDNSGLGINCNIPNGSQIGQDVMMGPNCFIHGVNHCFERTDIPMRVQGKTSIQPVIIDDDVWIGGNVTILPGKHIYRGSIIAANCVLTKDFPEYSIVGGNPSQLIKSRKQ